MIKIHEYPDKLTRTPERSCRWIATTTINGQVFTASSRTGAPHALARKLVEAGIPDDNVQITSSKTPGGPSLPGYASCRSFHAMAQYTHRESPTAPLHRVRFTEYPNLPGKPPRQG